MVYKLVSRQTEDGTWTDVAKASTGKASYGGRKYAARRVDERGVATAELIGVNSPLENRASDRPLIQDFVRDGEVLPGWTGPEAVSRAAQRHQDSLSELPNVVRRLQPGEAALSTVIS